MDKLELWAKQKNIENQKAFNSYNSLNSKHIIYILYCANLYLVLHTKMPLKQHTPLCGI